MSRAIAVSADVIKELARLRQLEAHVQRMFAKAAADHLYIGSGKDNWLADTRAAQEGPMVRQLRTLARIDTKGEDKIRYGN